MTLWVYLLCALIAGAFLPVQAGVNAQLTRWVGHPAAAALVSFAVGTMALLAYCLLLRTEVPGWGALSESPWWVWIGGLFGAVFVAAAAALAPKLGAATFTAVTVASQMIVSMLLDHYGLIGFPVRPVSGWRILGALLLVAGVALIRRF